MSEYMHSLWNGLDKLGYIGLEFLILGGVIWSMYKVLPKDMSIDLKISYGLIASSIPCLILYTIYKTVGA